DLVITGTECLDGDAMAEGVPAAVGECAVAHALPVVAVAWEILTTRTDDARAGVTTTYPDVDPRLSGRGPPRPQAPQDREALRRRARRIVKTWAQGRRLGEQQDLPVGQEPPGTCRQRDRSAGAYEPRRLKMSQTTAPTEELSHEVALTDT